MATPDELLQAVNARPDDDAARLAYADAVAKSEPDYAEFVKLQLARAADEKAAKAARGRPSSREQMLQKQHMYDWTKYMQRYVRDKGSDDGIDFWRGFVSWVRMEPENFVALGDRLFKMAPIQHADLCDGEEPVRGLFAAPGLARLDSLSLARTGLTDDDAFALAECEALRRCAWLDLSHNKLSTKGVTALARSPILATKVVVLLKGNPCDPVELPVLDYDGSVADMPASAATKLVEDAVGARVAWIHPPIPVPDRFHAMNFR
ncbi:MAG TPA: TIGR02996 domain-containing protein [Kofleriaceae bacterium]|jgi:uncharacterized protein (TIGR02996 family)